MKKNVYNFCFPTWKQKLLLTKNFEKDMKHAVLWKGTRQKLWFTDATDVFLLRNTVIAAAYFNEKYRNSKATRHGAEVETWLLISIKSWSICFL